MYSRGNTAHSPDAQTPPRVNKPNLLSNFLDRRSLTRPDGRPLYRYEIDDGEFARVERILKHNLCQDPSAVPRGIAPYLVLWGAEWFRRDFAGGHWTWATLTKRIGCAVEQAFLRDATERGLRFWGRSVRRTDASQRQFLLSIAAEGGLPSKLIAGESGPFKSYLGGVLKETESIGALDVEGAAGIAAAYANLMPHAFQTLEILADGRTCRQDRRTAAGHS
ncbi:MAG: STY4851/ECs_5259 family protein [Geminicoccaceae bacterium]|nr:STY4851/ECs_5259 family protein [Geminicoccaceae bacterium]